MLALLDIFDENGFLKYTPAEPYAAECVNSILMRNCVVTSLGL